MALLILVPPKSANALVATKKPLITLAKTANPEIITPPVVIPVANEYTWPDIVYLALSMLAAATHAHAAVSGTVILSKPKHVSNQSRAAEERVEETATELLLLR